MKRHRVYSHEGDADEIDDRKYWITASIINCFMSFFPGTFKIVSFLIATTSILSVLVVVFTLLTLKRKCVSSRKTSTLDYDVPDVNDRKYETLQRKTVADDAGTDTPAEYMEITAITSDIDLNMW